ncbi:MAG: SdrD B-like domain-containing protein [Gemmataceae bacterium]
MLMNYRRMFSRYFWNCTGTIQQFFFARTRKAHQAGRNARPWRIEWLEGRLVPASPLSSVVWSGTASTQITGTVYEDLDSNGVRNNGENGISGWTVYLDLDQDGTFNRDAAGDLEPNAVTNKDGDFIINHLLPGTYRLGEVVQPGWVATAPLSQDVTVENNRETRANFFNFSGGDIVGTLWNDLNADGVRDTDPTTGEFTEPGLEGWTVFLDFNNDRLVDPDEPTTLTDASGHYAFRNLAPDDYEVTEVVPDGWDISPGFDSRQTATVVARSEVTQDFANFSLTNGAIQGTIWNDTNVDGVRGTDPDTGLFTEPGLEGWTVYLDLNSDRVFDASEPSTVTDALGHYSFLSLPVGDYEVIEILPPSWDVSPTFDVRQTVNVRAGETSTASDFANFTILNGSIRGVIWNDANRDGIRAATPSGTFTEPGLEGWSVFIDLNHNKLADVGEPTAITDASGGYLFTDLQVGDYDVREVLPSGWEVTTTFSDNVTVTVYSGLESAAPDFANFNLATAVPGSISGTIWYDMNANGIRDVDSATGTFTDPGLEGWTVFADLNGNGVLDATEPNTITSASGSYTLTGLTPGSITVIEQLKPGYRPTAPSTGIDTHALRNGETATGIDFGNWALQEASIRGVVYADTNKDGARQAGEKGLDGIPVYLDLNENGVLDAGEPQTLTLADQFYTPGVDEAGTYSFTHLAAGTYTVRMVLPALLSSTPTSQLLHVVTLTAADNRTGVDCAAVYRSTEIHGIKFDDSNGNHVREADELGVPGVTIYVDLNRNNSFDTGEPSTTTGADGSYTFTDLGPGAYVLRELLDSGHESTYPTTTGGTLWPSGTSNPASGNVTPSSITVSLGTGASHRETVSLTLPSGGALTNLVDVFLLFDDTGSFVNNSPIVRGAFPDIITQLQGALPGIDLGFGVGRFEEYSNFAWEYGAGRPFILNQPIVAASTAGYMTAIQAALNRTTPGYGGDQPETDIEALYQLVTGLGFDGNNNGSVLDSGAAGLVSTQLNPGNSGDVPSFASFVADPTDNVLAAAGHIGGGGFRSGALPIILVATDTGFAYQPRGESTITGVGGVSLPLSALTETSRSTTPFNYGAGIQETITGLNALGALVIGLGTNTEANLDPRQGLEALSLLTGAVNRSTTTISNGTADAIAPNDPLYFQIASGFAGSVANGIVTAIQNAVTSVAVDVTIQASDPRVKIINHTGVNTAIGSGQTARFDIEFIGDGVPHRFDLQFVRNGTNVVLGSIPVVLGTPIPGSGYEFEDLSEGEICHDIDFGSHASSTTTSSPTITVHGGTLTYDAASHGATAEAVGSDGSPVGGTFSFTYNGVADLPLLAGTYTVEATFTSSDPNYAGGSATTTIVIEKATPTITNLNAPQIDEGTTTVIITGHVAAGPISPVGETVSATLQGVTQTGTVDANGDFSITFDTGALTSGTYPIVVSYSGNATSFQASADASTSLTVNTVSQVIPVTGARLSGTSGAPSTFTVATFSNILGDPTLYSATIVWGDGHTSSGTIAGNGATLSVVGTHTYAGPQTATIVVTIQDTLGKGLSGSATSTVSVKHLGLPVNQSKESQFWHGGRGQRLLHAFNGGSTHTELSTWLATNFSNLYGANAGANNLTNFTNDQVAAYFQRLWAKQGDGLATQMLTTALNVYASTSSLGGVQGSAYGFRVSATGLGARWFNVRKWGATVDAPNSSPLEVFDILARIDHQARNGVFYAGNRGLQRLAATMLKTLNSI